ncbi:bifunctional isocitrate dehydrogenase kinase/phosphatase [Pseudidiomarina aestuarii]|nr:bifunctional isocitrate dehydrogenase kinase/phosphatase [Pseudidiomarina aestuarii]
MTTDTHSRAAEELAQEILQGFQRHYDRFSHITAQARQRFADGAWLEGQQAAAARIHFYDERVSATTEQLREQTQGVLDEALWLSVRQHYETLLQFHPQAELAETFYNSVFCNLFHRRYFHNSYIFVESTLARTLPLAVETEYRSYFPVTEGLARCLLQIVETADFAAPFADLKRDLRQLQLAFQEQALSVDLQPEQSRIDVLKAPFYRNKAAYIVGRLVTTTATYPFIVPVLRTKQGQLYIDALITDRDQMAIIFGFARTYFMVQTRAPSALVRFLKDVMPNKTLAELYSAIGLHKQSKTEFYRDFLQHLDSSQDQLVAAEGIKGMVMTVFTLPSFPFVFKVIKDVFGGNKSMDRATVIERYRMVKRHDRAGRMADTYEFANVAIPLVRISPELLEELQATVAGSLKIDGDHLIIRHLFVERRMTPLNLFLDSASPAEVDAVMKDYGQAIKDMIAANIFPGDMLLKNFGLTRQRRVVFYDYDEVRYLTDMNFRELPRATTIDEQMAAEPWYAVGPDDMFPEQLPVFAVPQPKLRQALLKFHADLATPEFWQRQQQHIQQGIVSDVFPYPETLRFINQIPQTDSR